MLRDVIWEFVGSYCKYIESGSYNLKRLQASGMTEMRKESAIRHIDEVMNLTQSAQ